MEYKFNKNYSVVATVEGQASLSELEKEVSMYSATPEFCRMHGGEITKNLLDNVPASFYQEAAEKGLYPNIDIRIHRLYPGNYPAYPGWHCDAQFRETYFGQPKSEHTQLSNHLIGTISSHEDGISNTEFIDEEVTLEIDDYDPTEGAPFWGLIDEKLRQRKNKTWIMPDGSLTRFDCWTLHRTMPAKKRGWRLFFRMAMWYRPNINGGQLSKQEMIYMDISKQTGW